MKTRARRGWGSTVIGLCLLAVMLFPVYWMVNASLQPAGNTLNATWFPFEFDLEGYRSALQGQGRYLANSLLIASSSVLVSLFVAVPAAYGLALLRVRFASGVIVGILITQMVPGIVVANALYGAYNDLGLLNSYVGLVLADSTAGIPFAILILRAFMVGIPREVLEAARVDGANRLRSLWSVVIPVSRSGLVTAGLFTFLFTWSDFLFALTLTTDDRVRPITLGIYTYIGANASEWNAIMATAVIASVPAAVMLIAAQRHIVAGATTGAVK